MPVAEKKYYCSFCYKTDMEVFKMIAGVRVFICNECVDLCVDIIREERAIALRQDPGEIEYLSWGIA